MHLFTMKLVAAVALLPVAFAANTGVTAPTDAIIKKISSESFLHRQSRNLMVSEQCTAEVEALLENQEFLDATIEFESSLMGTCDEAISVSGSDTNMNIALDLASCDTSKLDEACIAAGGKPITIKAADLSCEAEGATVNVSIKEYTDCAGMSCPDTFDPSEIQPEILKELEQEAGVTCQISGSSGETTTPPGDTTSGSVRAMPWTIYGALGAFSAGHLLL